jgi:amidase
VTDAAIMLSAMEGAAPDPHDAATARCTPPQGRDYTQFLKADALKGARIGVPRAYFIDSYAVPGAPKPSEAIPDDQKAMMTEVVAVLRGLGATVLDPADPPSALAKDPAKNMLVKGSCTNLTNSKGKDANCSVVLKYSFKRDFQLWLDSLGAAAPVKNLTELRQWNVDHAAMGTLKYRQDTMDMSDEMDLAADRARYEADRAQDMRLTGPEGFDKLFKQKRLDAVIFAGSRGSSFLAKSGYPSVSVPYGMVANGTGFPPGFTPKPAPLGVAFSGLACSEPKLLAIAYAFEQATKKRRPPEL